ncbi:MAG TPA: lysine transporter LysE [Firmicutes bacterium]|jgi:threonine/homoserine/homoserine lactone efflux protein|nr:lysine transporter LysE [Bacillota bacterium]
MTLHLLWKGILIGVLIAAPVGPIGFLCIKRTLNAGRLHGFVAGLGAATADTIYGAVAGFGLTVVSNVLIHYHYWLRLGGGLFLCGLGIISFFSKPAIAPENFNGKSLIGVYFSTFLLTLANPLTVLAFTAIFAGLGVGRGLIRPEHRQSTGATQLLILGVFLGSVVWWLFLTMLVGGFRSKFDYRKLLWVNRISGMVICGFGLVVLCFKF